MTGPGGSASGPPGYLETDENQMLSNLRNAGYAVQAGTPMTATGETLPCIAGAGGWSSDFICPKISSGGGAALRRRGGQTAPHAGHGAGGCV